MALDVVTQIKERLSIESVVSKHVELKKAGKYLKANCPFHNEKTPSFYVSQDKDTYHCFGCGKGGDIFSFIQEIERIEFKEALRVLADQAGVKIVAEDYKLSKKNEVLLDIHLKAKMYYIENLKENRNASDYLKKRGLKNSTISDFEIGVSEDSWNGLTKFLLKQGFPDRALLDSGLTIKSNKGLFDRFRNRIMFPINNDKGQTIAFTARLYDDKNSSVGAAKYVNSPETLLYKKSEVLYAMDKAKDEIRKLSVIQVVEGQMDAIALHQVGIKNVVSISGTALSDFQVDKIRRFADEVVLAFDSDSAGIDASLRSAVLLLRTDVKTSIVIYPKDSDPADIVFSKESELWLKYFEERLDFIEGYIKIISQTSAKEEVHNRIIKDIYPLIFNIESAIKREMYAEKISKSLSVSMESVMEDLKNIGRKPTSNMSTQNLSIEYITINDVCSSMAVLKDFNEVKYTELVKFFEDTAERKFKEAVLDSDKKACDELYIEYDVEHRENILKVSEEILCRYMIDIFTRKRADLYRQMKEEKSSEKILIEVQDLSNKINICQQRLSALE